MLRERYLCLGTPTSRALATLDPDTSTLLVTTVAQMAQAAKHGIKVTRVREDQTLDELRPVHAVWLFRKHRADLALVRAARKRTVAIVRWYKQRSKTKERGRLAGVQGGSPRGASLKNDIRCPYKFAAHHVLPYMDNLSAGFVREHTPEPLARGDLIHQVLANHNARLQAEQRGDNPDEFMTPKDAYTEVLRMHQGDQGYDAIKSVVVKPLRVYMAAHQARNAPWEIVEVEAPGVLWVDDDGNVCDPPPDAAERLAHAAKRPVQPFESGPYPHTFRRDLLTRQNGLLLDIDYKSMASAAKAALANTMTHYMGDLQLTLHHIHARRAFGDALAGSYVQAIELQSPYRAPLLDAVSQSHNATLRAPQTVLWFERQVRTLWATTNDPRRWPAVLSTGGPCVEWGGTCPFYRPCRTT